MKRLFVVLILVGLGFATWYGLQAAGYLGKSEFSSDPQVAELQRLQRSFADKPGARPDESQRQAMGEKIRELSDEQRREFFASARRSMENMMEARMERFFTLSPEEQKKQLDEDIDRMERARRQGRSGGSRSGGSRGERGGDSKSNQAGKESSNGAAKQGSNSQRRGSRDSSPEARNQRRKQMLSRTSPEQRAMFTAYKTRLDARMRERGLQPPPSR